MSLTQRSQLHIESAGGSLVTLHQTDIDGATETHAGLVVGADAPASPFDGLQWRYQGATTEGRELFEYDSVRGDWLSVRTVDVSFSAPHWFCSSRRAYFWCDTQPAINDTLVIGPDEYTFVTTPSAAYEVARGANASEAMRNLAWAINQPVWDPEGAPPQWDDLFFADATPPSDSAVAYAFPAGSETDQEAYLLIIQKPGYQSGYATGTVTFTGDPTATDTITIAGRVYTFVASPAAADDVDIKAGDTTAQAAALARAINAAPEATHGTDYFASKGGANAFVRANGGAGVVTLTARSPGTSGNTISLAEDADNTAISGAMLTGGGAFNVSKSGTWSATSTWRNTPSLLRAATGAAATITVLTDNGAHLYPHEFFIMDGIMPCSWNQGWWTGGSSDASSDDPYVAVQWSYQAPMAAGPSTLGSTSIGFQLWHAGVSLSSLSVPYTPTGTEQIHRYRNVLDLVGAAGSAFAVRGTFNESGVAWPSSLVPIPPGAVVKVAFKKRIT